MLMRGLKILASASITDVHVTSDFEATIYVSLFGSDKEKRYSYRFKT